MLNNKYKTKKIISVCESKSENFKQRNSGHIIIKVGVRGKTVATTAIPHKNKCLPKGTYKAIAEDLKLTVEEFDNFLACKFTRDQYIERLTSYLESDKYNQDDF